MKSEAPSAIEWGVAYGPPSGSSSPSHLHVVKTFSRGALVAVAGAAHGNDAALDGARALLEANATQPVNALMKQCHELLHAMPDLGLGVAVFDALSASLSWSALGNVNGLLLRSASAGAAEQPLPVGIGGASQAPFDATVLALAPGDTLVLTLASAGVPLLGEPTRGQPPQAAAETILGPRSAASPDALVLVASFRGGPAARLAEADEPLETVPDVLRSYSAALEEYLAGAGDAALRRAGRIGRHANARGMGVLEMATIHHEALSRVLLRRGARGLEQDLRRAEAFFSESISPYQPPQLGVRDTQAIAALQKLNDTLEQEMRRIAHAVHDDAGQLLDAARLAMARVALDLGPTLRERLLKEVGTILDQVELELRRFSHELRPTILDDLGLIPALQFLADGISKRAHLAVKIESTVQGRADACIETALYRVVQEALNNVTRHASARNVKIELTRDNGHLQCRVHDDGVGFDVPSVLSKPEKRGLGLIGISERLNAVRGTLQINSVVGRGTDLLIEIPVGK